MAAEQVRVVQCRGCGGSWPSPTTEQSARAEVARLVREHRLIEGIRLLRERTGLGLAEAKAVTQHITRESGVCHRCGAQLGGGELTPCPGCGSLNYDW